MPVSAKNMLFYICFIYYITMHTIIYAYGGAISPVFSLAYYIILMVPPVDNKITASEIKVNS